MEIKIFDQPTTFNDLREDWRGLFAAVPRAAPFLSFEWAAAWFDFFGKDRQPFVLAIYRNAELVALLPLCLEKKRVLGLPLDKLSFIAAETGGAGYLDALVLPEYKTQAVRAFQQFFETRADIGVFEFEGIAADSDLLQTLTNETDDKKFQQRVQPCDVCRFAEVTDETAGDYLKRIFNDTAKKKVRRMERLGGFEFRRITAPVEAVAAFDRFAVLHQSNWAEKGGSEVTGSEVLLDFHRRVVADSAVAGTVFFDELWVENKCVAGLYGFARGNDDVYYYYSTGFDHDYFKYSPMATLYNLSIENGIKNGFKIFDFLRGGQDYKEHWATGANELVTLTISRRTTAAAIEDGRAKVWLAARGAANSMLPADSLERLKSWRRKRKRDALAATAEVNGE